MSAKSGPDFWDNDMHKNKKLTGGQAPASKLALPPAAVVSTQTARSCA